MQIKDVMTRDVVAVPEGMSVVDVAQLLMEHRVHAVPVIDEARHVLGIITETDFFLKGPVAMYLPAYIDLLKDRKALGAKDMKGVPELEKLVLAAARDIMTVNCKTLPETADVQDLITLVKQYHYKTFPVIDSQNVLIGVATLIDVIRNLEWSPEKNQYL